MGRIREDLVGVVWAGGVNLAAGDEVPEGVSVGEDLLEPVKFNNGGLVGDGPKPVRNDTGASEEIIPLKTTRRRGRPSKSEE